MPFVVRWCRGIEDSGGIVRAALYAVVPEAGLAEMHELVPHDDRRIGGYLLYLSALGEHVSGLHRAGQRILDAGDDDVDGAGVLADGLDLVIELVERHNGNAFGLVDVELELLFAGERVHHVGDGTGEVHGVEHVYRLRAVRHGDGDLVALAYTDGAQTARAFFDVGDHFAVGRGAPHEVKGDVVRVLVGYLLDGLKHGALEIFKMRRHVAEVFYPRGLGGDFQNNCLLSLVFHLSGEGLFKQLRIFEQLSQQTHGSGVIEAVADALVQSQAEVEHGMHGAAAVLVPFRSKMLLADDTEEGVGAPVVEVVISWRQGRWSRDSSGIWMRSWDRCG